LLRSGWLNVLKLLSRSGIGTLSACSLALDGSLVLQGLTLRDLVDLGDPLFHALCIVKELLRLVELASCLLLEMRLIDIGIFSLIDLLRLIWSLAEISE